MRMHAAVELLDRGVGMIMRGAELDTLIALVEQGPLWDGDLPSKTGRDCLIERGLAVRGW